MKSIGGYFGLEMHMRGEYHSNAVGLNSGRRCLEYILRARACRKILIPYYVCNAVVETIEKLGMQYEYYKINRDFSPNIHFSRIDKNNVLLYVNYFGINDSNVQAICKKTKHVVIDNSQAFFSKPIRAVDTFYSPRKFFGVPDGGYAYTNARLGGNLERSSSANRWKHLLLRTDESPEKGYKYFMKNEERFSHEPIQLMSNSTTCMLQSIDYRSVLRKRKQNFLYYHTHLSDMNELAINEGITGALAYPFLCNKSGLKEYLIHHKIYIPTYWKEVSDKVAKVSFEYFLANNLVSLPLDQRYSTKDLQIVIDTIHKFII